MNPFVEEIYHESALLALIVSHRFDAPGIHFFTAPELSQQLAYMHHPAGKIIEPHVHNRTLHEVHYTQEVLVIRKGRVRVDFYDPQGVYVESRILGTGDIILLASGGHGFEVLDDLEMIEVKQGPFSGDADKTRIAGIPAGSAVIRNSQ